VHLTSGNRYHTLWQIPCDLSSPRIPKALNCAFGATVQKIQDGTLKTQVTLPICPTHSTLEDTAFRPGREKILFFTSPSTTTNPNHSVNAPSGHLSAGGKTAIQWER
jgi:hypothetical protein